MATKIQRAQSLPSCISVLVPPTNLISDISDISPSVCEATRATNIVSSVSNVTSSCLQSPVFFLELDHYQRMSHAPSTPNATRISANPRIAVVSAVNKAQIVKNLTSGLLPMKSVTARKAERKVQENTTATAGNVQMDRSISDLHLYRQQLTPGTGHAASPVQEILNLHRPTSAFEQELTAALRWYQSSKSKAKLADNKDSVSSSAGRAGALVQIDIKHLATHLLELGYLIQIREGGATGPHPMQHKYSTALKRLQHKFLVCLGKQDNGEPSYLPAPLLVEPHFREQFVIANVSSIYDTMLTALPQVFVGNLARLHAVVTIMGREVESSFKASGRSLPPWRTRQAVLSKWAPEQIQELERIMSRYGGETANSATTTRFGQTEPHQQANGLPAGGLGETGFFGENPVGDGDVSAAAATREQQGTGETVAEGDKVSAGNGAVDDGRCNDSSTMVMGGFSSASSASGCAALMAALTPRQSAFATTAPTMVAYGDNIAQTADGRSSGAGGRGQAEGSSFVPPLVQEQQQRVPSPFERASGDVVFDGRKSEAQLAATRRNFASPFSLGQPPTSSASTDANTAANVQHQQLRMQLMNPMAQAPVNSIAAVAEAAFAASAAPSQQLNGGFEDAPAVSSLVGSLEPSLQTLVLGTLMSVNEDASDGEVEDDDECRNGGKGNDGKGKAIHGGGGDSPDSQPETLIDRYNFPEAMRAAAASVAVARRSRRTEIGVELMPPAEEMQRGAAAGSGLGVSRVTSTATSTFTALATTMTAADAVTSATVGSSVADIALTLAPAPSVLGANVPPSAPQQLTRGVGNDFSYDNGNGSRNRDGNDISKDVVRRGGCSAFVAIQSPSVGPSQQQQPQQQQPQQQQQQPQRQQGGFVSAFSNSALFCTSQSAATGTGVVALDRATGPRLPAQKLSCFASAAARISNNGAPFPPDGGFLSGVGKIAQLAAAAGDKAPQTSARLGFQDVLSPEEIAAAMAARSAALSVPTLEGLKITKRSNSDLYRAAIKFKGAKSALAAALDRTAAASGAVNVGAVGAAASSGLSAVLGGASSHTHAAATSHAGFVGRVTEDGLGHRIRTVRWGGAMKSGSRAHAAAVAAAMQQQQQ